MLVRSVFLEGQLFWCQFYNGVDSANVESAESALNQNGPFRADSASQAFSRDLFEPFCQFKK